MSDTMLMTISAGVVRITREGADAVLFRFTGENCAWELHLTAEEGGSLGAALNRWSSPRHHPGVCPVCEQIGGTKGCQCDPTPMREMWGVFLRPGANAEDQTLGDPVSEWETKEDAAKECQRLNTVEQCRRLDSVERATGGWRQFVVFSYPVPAEDDEE